jgi:ribosomal protein L37AE/L43A
MGVLSQMRVSGKRKTRYGRRQRETEQELGAHNEEEHNMCKSTAAARVVSLRAGGGLPRDLFSESGHGGR